MSTSFRIALLLALAGVAHAAPPYVVSSRTSNAIADIWEYDLYRVEGGHRTRLTERAGPEGEPAVDAHGELLAFVAPVDGHFQLFTMPLAGGALTQRTNGPAEAGHPSFDPSGEKLVLPLTQADGHFGLALLDLTSNATRTLVAGAYHCWSPEWSPDGRRIAFVSDRDGQAGIYLFHVESGGVERLTSTDVSERDPHWSPDGARLAFSRRLSRDRADVWVADVARGTRAPVVQGAGLNLQPCFTPDGASLLFTSNRGGSFNIWQLVLATGAVSACDPGPHSDQNARALWH